MLPFHFQLRDGIPVSEQLAQAVRRAILAGGLEAGQEFPSVRVLAKELRISPTTAQKVIGELKAEGYLASRPGIGMVISAQEPPPREALMAHLRPHCDALLREAARLGLTSADAAEALRLAAGQPDSPIRAADESTPPPATPSNARRDAAAIPRTAAARPTRARQPVST